MEIRPIGANAIHFPIKRGKATEKEDMVKEPAEKESTLLPRWTSADATIIIIPKGNVKINKDNV
jgi:hypothetical protein